MEVVDNNYDLCAFCGDFGEKNRVLYCCDRCPKAYHKMCIKSSKIRKELENKSWTCPHCQNSDESEFDFEDVKCNLEQYQKYVGSMFSSKTERLPSLGLLLLHLEWIVNQTVLKRIATCVSQYMTIDRGHEWEAAQSNDSLNFYLLITEIRSAVGDFKFDQTCAIIAAGQSVLAIGMSPSLKYLNKLCRNCGAIRYTHKFCYRCGNLFNAVEDCRKSLLGMKNGQSKRSANKEFSGIRKASVLSELDLVALKCEFLLRLCCYLAAIHYLYVRSHDTREDFATHGGDYLFLMRNLALNSVGIHRTLARRHYKKVSSSALHVHGRLQAIDVSQVAVDGVRHGAAG